ncbi:fumarylacetoacetate hydrolase family protein [Bergeriella denitrificans]|uniref:Putative hydrolase n=1 Tax=Bergeriella denitrificans TaxID=494 RepID=A0A378UFR2_BERDE|nr:fumarylacetoacetate hydrolase family protein [Bergeriella denitrificans]STZ76224.1 putative hydrolase [Bergeriella denitrificans]
MAAIRLDGRETGIGNIFCIGRNYVAHIEELNNEMPSEMVVFSKPTTSLLAGGGRVRLPSFSADVHFECELVLYIGRDCDGLAEGEDWRDYVAGYGVGLDLTARDVQSRLKNKGLPWLKAKGFRDSACVSDFLPAAALPNPDDCAFSLHINGSLRQHGQTRLLIHPLGKIVNELAQIYGLRQGDLIFTGTPEGVGQLHSGNVLRLDLAGLVQAEFQVE